MCLLYQRIVYILVFKSIFGHAQDTTIFFMYYGRGTMGDDEAPPGLKFGRVLCSHITEIQNSKLALLYCYCYMTMTYPIRCFILTAKINVRSLAVFDFSDESVGLIQPRKRKKSPKGSLGEIRFLIFDYDDTSSSMSRFP